MNRVRSLITIHIVVTITLLGSCATAHHVSIAPVRSDYPVSTSPSVMTRDGTVYSSSKEYRVVGDFALPISLEGSVARETEDQLDLTATLVAQLEELGGDAIVNLNITMQTYDTGPTIGAGAAETAGTFAGIAGLAILAAGGALDSDTLRTMGGFFTFIGAAGWGTGLALQYFGDTTLQLMVTGDVVSLE